jgi:hypothetical protein
LPARRPEARLLIVGDCDAAFARQWPGHVSHWPDQMLAHRLRDVDALAVDVVAIPEFRSTFESRDVSLLAALIHRLRNDTVVAGCTTRTWRSRHAMARSDSRRMVGTLENAGLVDVECFFVHPTIDDPAALIPAAPRAAAAHIRFQLDIARPHFTTLGYGMRRLAIAAGLGARSQAEMFFWSRRSC